MRPARVVPRRRWSPPWSQVLAGLVILLGLGIFLYPQAASWFSQRDQSRVTEAARELLDQPPHDEASYRDEQIELAHQYNQALASGAVLAANSRVPTGRDTGAEAVLAYASLLDVGPSGLMGRLQYTALEIDLPIYHGTSDDTLLHGVGHLEGTSLPVGGAGTRSVLTAHRGLPTSRLFNDLDRAALGDTVTVTVLDRVISYRVIDVTVVEPDASEAIWPEPDRDLITLVTCTPLGINTHRILVTAERITPTPPLQAEAAAADPELPGFPWWAVWLGAGVLVVAGYVWWSGRGPAPGSSSS